MLAAFVVVLIAGNATPVAIAALLSFLVLLVRRRLKQRQARIGTRYAHQLTLLRLLLLCAAAAALPKLQPYILLAIFSGNVALDVVDGFIARRLNQQSSFGGVFDREVDAIYVLVASLYFYLEIGIPAWILVPAVLPYFYRLAAWSMGNPPISGAKQPHAAFLAGVNFVLILLAVALSGDAQFFVLVISTAIVTLSFLASFRDLVRLRNDKAAP